jgi:hypothetical protein
MLSLDIWMIKHSGSQESLHLHIGSTECTPTVQHGTYLKYYHYIFITCIATLHNNPGKQSRIFHLMCSSTFLQSNGAKSQIKPCPTQFFTSSHCYSQQSTSSVDDIKYVQHQILYTIFPHIFLGLSTISFLQYIC